jgi:hypothetical protein
MKTKMTILVIITVTAVAALLLARRPAAPRPLAHAVPVISATQPKPAPMPAWSESFNPPKADQPADAPAPAKISPPDVAAISTGEATPAPKPAKRTPKPKPPIQDPTARVALSFVGLDPDAETYWVSAINDPTLPAEERKDLIEDLNEDGLSNPHHPAPEDMPLIASRILLIEELAPVATDPVNVRAFQEAYKDLVNLYNGLPAD